MQIHESFGLGLSKPIPSSRPQEKGFDKLSQNGRA